MHKIVLTSSATWLFDVSKNVVSSTLPEKNRIPKLCKAHKSKVTVTLLEEKNIQVLDQVLDPLSLALMYSSVVDLA